MTKILEKYSGLKFIHTNLFFFQPFHIYQFSMGFIIIYCYTGFTCNNNNNNNNNSNNNNNNNNNSSSSNFIYPGKRPASQSTKVDRLVLIGDQHTKNI